MALLEFKKEQEKLKEDASTIYLLDEPDTHLHAGAQIDLLKTLQSFARADNQVILTTHSPFLINSVKPHQLRLLERGTNNCSKIKCLEGNADISAEVLQSIGIENVQLFFARTIIIVEGETEYEFITNYYLKAFNRSINSDLIKVINVGGIKNIYGFAKGVLALHKAAGVFAVFDNDLSDDLRDLISHLQILPENKFIIGHKEFEDSFADDVLFYCWKKHYESRNRTCPESWTPDNICQIRNNCALDQGLKFSKQIKSLNPKGIAMTKPVFGRALAEYVEQQDLPSRLNDLFQSLIS